MAKRVIMPALGMAQETGTIIEWLKEAGDSVNEGDPLLEIETDKTTAVLEAEATGTLTNITAFAGDVVPVAETIAWILTPGESLPEEAKSQKQTEPTTTAASRPEPTEPASPSPDPKAPAPVQATPVALRIAQEHDVDLTSVKPMGGQVTKNDVLAYLDEQQPVTAPAPGQATPASEAKLLPASPKARRLADEQGFTLSQIPGSGPDGAILATDVLAFEPPAPDEPTLPGMSQAWRVMAQRLSQSWQTVPHFYLTRDVDAVALRDWRSATETEATIKVTYTDLLIKVVATCLRSHPRLNAAWIEDDIQANDHINVGLAVAVEDGLLAPVIHDADTMSVSEIATARSRIVARAQTGKLSTRDLQGGTFTISNLGMYGIDDFSAIVNPPQAAILAVGRIADRVVPVQGKPAVRPQMTLTLSLDHRVVDGVRGAQFLETVVNAIEERRSPKKRESGMTDEKFEQGMQIRRQVLGDAHVDRAEANKTAFDADFQRFITETAWGAVWARPSLDKKTRHLLTIAMLAALGKEHELTMHIRATKNTGVTAEEVKEVLLQVAIYAGVPAANSAIAAAKKVYQQEEGEG